MIPLLLRQLEEILKEMIDHDLIDVVDWSNIFLLLKDERDETGVGFEIGKPRLREELSICQRHDDLGRGGLFLPAQSEDCATSMYLCIPF